jgi:hypothetical protein
MYHSFAYLTQLGHDCLELATECANQFSWVVSVDMYSAYTCADLRDRKETLTLQLSINSLSQTTEVNHTKLVGKARDCNWNSRLWTLMPRQLFNPFLIFAFYSCYLYDIILICILEVSPRILHRYGRKTPPVKTSESMIKVIGFHCKNLNCYW